MSAQSIFKTKTTVELPSVKERERKVSKTDSQNIPAFKSEKVVEKPTKQSEIEEPERSKKNQESCHWRKKKKFK